MWKLLTETYLVECIENVKEHVTKEVFFKRI